MDSSFWFVKLNGLWVVKPLSICQSYTTHSGAPHLVHAKSDGPKRNQQHMINNLEESCGCLDFSLECRLIPLRLIMCVCVRERPHMNIHLFMQVGKPFCCPKCK